MKKKKVIYSYLRHPRTTAERRANADPDMKEFVRAKRRPDNLPDDWDDIPCGVWKDKYRAKARSAA